MTGCGDNGVTCGDGTHDEGGYCLPDNGGTCGTGTIEVNGTCVPDGSVVCVQGTVFDPATGTCVVDPSACADGTTLVDGACVPDDDLLMGAADLVEAAEPNAGPAVAGTLDAPALDASTTFYGCITAYEDADGDGNLDADYDAWIVNASGPMVLEVTTDGIHGLSAGFIAVSADVAHPAELDSWQRIGINLTGDTAKREIYLPAAGRYALLVTDARSLFLGDAGGGTEDSCYFATVKQVAMPAAVPLTTPVQASTDAGKVKLFTYTAAEGGLLDLSMNTASPALAPAFVSLRGTTLHKAAADDPPFDTIGGLAAGDVVSVIVDPLYNYGVTPQAYTIDSFAPTPVALPTDGSTITLSDNNVAGATAYTDINYSYFDVAAAGLKRFDVTADIPVDMVILRRDIFTPAGSFDTFASIDAFLGGAGTSTFNTQFIKFLTPGRYYFATLNPAGDNAGGNYAITASVADVSSSALTLGTEVTGQALTDGNAFHTLDLTDPVWIEFGVTATADWGTGTVGIAGYDLAGEGWLRTGTAPATPVVGNIYPAFTGTQPAVAPFAPMGRIIVGDSRDFLVRVTPSATPGAAPTYSMLAQNRAGLVDLGTIAVGTPLNQTLAALANGTPARIIARAVAGSTLAGLAHPTAAADIRLRRVSATEVVQATTDATGVGGDEQISATVGAAPANWVAWVVDNKTVGISTDVALSLTASVPRPYTIASGALPFTDICGVGTDLTADLGLDDDEDLALGQTLPAGFSAFELFGSSVPATFGISTNGWLAWAPGTDPAYSNPAIPTASGPNGVIAPYWEDLASATICRYDDAGAGTVTIQWTGNKFLSALTVEVQVVLHANGVLDFIYGPNHLTDGTDGSVGAENLTGTFGQQIVFNTAGVILPNTSRTLTPM